MAGESDAMQAEFDAADDRPPARFTPMNALLLAATLGLAAGLGELAVLGIQDAIDPVVTVDSIRTNRHYAWMIPLSDLGLFAAVGSVFALVARRWPYRVIRWEPMVLTLPMVVAPLLAVRGLFPAAALILGLGVATKLGHWLGRRPESAQRLARWGFPILLAVAAVIGIWKPGRPAPTRHLVAPTERPQDGPNVLLLVLDTVRADHLSLYGYDRATTPNLQRWAQRGVRFDRARAPAPWTLPSHASMLTGFWPHQLSSDASHGLDDARPTLAEYLGDRGYATGGFVANTYYCNAWYGLDRGFDRYEDFPENDRVGLVEILRSSTLGRRVAKKLGYRLESPGERGSRKTAGTINRDALAWIDSLPEGQPYFAFLNYYDAHGPYEPPPGATRRFVNRDAAGADELGAIREYEAMVRKPGTVAEGAVQGAGAVAGRVMVDAYDDCIASLDAEIGRLLDDLDRRGTLAKTLVVITSDHGEHFGDRGLFGHGVSLYRPLLDVPLLILPPARAHVPTPLVVADPVSLRALPSTVADALGLARGSAQPFPGASLAGLWEPNRAPPTATEPPLSVVEQQHRFRPSAHIPASLGPLWSLADAGLTYIRAHDGTEQLYDARLDPGEARDLATLPESAPSLARCRATLARLLSDPAPRQAATADAHLGSQSPVPTRR